MRRSRTMSHTSRSCGAEVFETFFASGECCAEKEWLLLVSTDNNDDELVVFQSLSVKLVSRDALRDR